MVSPSPCIVAMDGDVVRDVSLSKKKGARWDPSRLARCIFPGAVGVGRSDSKKRLPNGSLAPEELLSGPRQAAAEEDARGAFAPAVAGHVATEGRPRPRPCLDDADELLAELGVPWENRDVAPKAAREEVALPCQLPTTPPAAAAAVAAARADASAAAALAEIACLDVGRPPLPPLPRVASGSHVESWSPPAAGSEDSPIRHGTPPQPPLSRPPSSQKKREPDGSPAASGGRAPSPPPLPQRQLWPPAGATLEVPLLPPELPASPGHQERRLEAELAAAAAAEARTAESQDGGSFMAPQGSEGSNASARRRVPRGPLSKDSCVFAPSQRREQQPDPPSRPPLPQWSPQLLATISEAPTATGADEPLPLELLEEQGLDDAEGGGDFAAFLPPLPQIATPSSATAPALSASRIDAANEIERPQESDVDAGTLLEGERHLVLRPVLHYRVPDRKDDVRPLPQKFKSCVGGGNSGVALSSRPTTAGDDGSGEESLASAVPPSRQSVRSWREEWTPGACAPPPPPLMSAERVAIGVAASMPRMQGSSSSSSLPAAHNGVPRPPRPPALPSGAAQVVEPTVPVATRQVSDEDSFEAALKRLSNSRAASIAHPPPSVERRWAGSRPGSAAGRRGIGSGPVTPAGTRPSSAKADGRPHARQLDEAIQGGHEADDDRPSSAGSAPITMQAVGGTTMRKKFSELALSFAALDDGSN